MIKERAKRKMHKDKKEKERRCRKKKKTNKHSPLFLSAFLKLLRAKKHLRTEAVDAAA